MRACMRACSYLVSVSDERSSTAMAKCGRSLAALLLTELLFTFVGSIQLHLALSGFQEAECRYTYVNDSRPIEAEAAVFHRRGFRCCVFLIQAPSQYRVTLNFTHIFGFQNPPAPQQDPSTPHRGHVTYSLPVHPSSSKAPTLQDSGVGEGGIPVTSISPDPSSSTEIPDEPPIPGRTGDLREGPVHAYPEGAPGARTEEEGVSLEATLQPGGGGQEGGGGDTIERSIPGRGRVDDVAGHQSGDGQAGQGSARGRHDGCKRDGHTGKLPGSVESWPMDLEGDFPKVQVREVLPGQEKVFAVISQSCNNHQSPQVMETHSQSVKVVYIWGSDHQSGFTLYFDFVRNASLCDEAHGELHENCGKAQPSNSLELMKVAILVGCVVGVLLVLAVAVFLKHVKCRATLLHQYPHSRHPHHHPQSQSSEAFASSPVQEHMDQQVALLRDRHGSGPGSGGGGSQGEVEVGLPPQIPLSLDGEEGYSASQRQLALAHATHRASQQDLFRPPPNRTVHDRVSPPPYTPAPPSPPPYSPYPHATWSGGSSLDLLGSPLPRCHSLSARHSAPLDQLSFLPPNYSPGGYSGRAVRPHAHHNSHGPSQGRGSPPQKHSPPQRQVPQRRYSPPYGHMPPGRGAPWHPHLQTLPPDSFQQEQDVSWGLPRSRHASEPVKGTAPDRTPRGHTAAPVTESSETSESVGAKSSDRTSSSGGSCPKGGREKRDGAESSESLTLRAGVGTTMSDVVGSAEDSRSSADSENNV